MHGRRAANVHLAIRTANCRGRYCCRVNSPEKAHSYLHGRRAVKVFWSSGRPLLCFSRFWPSENVARIRRVYFAYSRTKSVHTRNIASNAKGKCVFCFDCAKWSHYFIHRVALAARTKFHDVSTNEKTKLGLARMVTSQILCKKTKMGS